ncbi:GNAT family N-acetyltransferase [Sphingomonas psychrolutea]|uniref:Ribosomal-protein-alanine acetyltransferase n=1 Tax=Sphingomonas psychrolutea TaxID=1259676 RepID=A0ABQ1G120_9SPHN|nr:GNAT family N-acetyltransferase [Sphingomonas psychrolutea]GGA34607.1 ribosomal-protein-alanine acetyltransferase [Sphingomonas psychrolutea]
MSTMLRIDLRSGAVADLAVIDRLMRDAFEPRFGEAWTHNQVLGLMAMPGVWLTIAEIGSEPAGFALSRRVLDEAELLLLATAPMFRRRGVGAALLRSVISDSGMQGARTLHLEVRDGNDAIKLYRAVGFDKVGERRHYYRGVDGKAFDALTYRREIS